MGRPKFSTKKYESPSHPWQEERIKIENELIKKYGLKNKREIWKAQTSLKKYRSQARDLLAKVSGVDPQMKKEKDQLLMHLTRFNILQANSNLDDVLALDTEALLSRRLQTLTYLKGLASTPKQARQLISHGHIAIEGRKITVPSYMVSKDEEANIEYVEASPLNDDIHPARPKSDFKSVFVKSKKEDVKPEDKKDEGKKKKEIEDKKPKETDKPKTEPGKKEEVKKEPETKDIEPEKTDVQKESTPVKDEVEKPESGTKLEKEDKPQDEKPGEVKKDEGSEEQNKKVEKKDEKKIEENKDG